MRMLPTVRAQLHPLRHRGFSRLPRYSKETPRANSATSRRTSARYREENMIAIRRSVSLRPMNACSAPTPKSKPSSTKKPTQKAAMMTNQIVCSCMASVGQSGEGAGGRLGLGRLGVGLGQAAAGVAQHEVAVSGAEDDVGQDERGEADPDLGGADRGRAGAHRLLQPLHDPWLPAALGQKPPGG